MILLAHSGMNNTFFKITSRPPIGIRTSPIPFAAILLPFATRIALPGERLNVPVMKLLLSLVTCTAAPESKSHANFDLPSFKACDGRVNTS